MCEHRNFKANVAVARLVDTGRFNAAITIECAECGTPMQFLGLEPGVNMEGANVSMDGREARIAIVPEGSRPNPLQRLIGMKPTDLN